ncbi:hypothetical protein GQ55_9G558200 [Panicum hallii var. hallii]|uniref:Uncharacterized protein n=1 Tax=Panicum hallii var. hallii TaxID=1504633 RepID=A0A2T7CFN2_9POAL|nr:hypothetical protein GQ55_9G558200 [Panicum hallii var. hallii]
MRLEHRRVSCFGCISTSPACVPIICRAVLCVPCPQSASRHLCANHAMHASHFSYPT